MSEIELRSAFGDGPVDVLLERIAGGTSREIDPRLSASSFSFDEKQTREFLDAAAGSGLLERREILYCPNQNCRELIDEQAANEELCPFCREAFSDHGGVEHRIVYQLHVRGTRDIAWLIAIHGFNTHGPWQQEFSWRIATKLKYSAPVLIYKYGLIRISVLVRWRHRQLARNWAQPSGLPLSTREPVRFPSLRTWSFIASAASSSFNCWR